MDKWIHRISNRINHSLLQYISESRFGKGNDKILYKYYKINGHSEISTIS